MRRFYGMGYERVEFFMPGSWGYEGSSARSYCPAGFWSKRGMDTNDYMYASSSHNFMPSDICQYTPGASFCDMFPIIGSD